MTAKSEIEKHQLSLDSRMRPPIYQKRAVSMSHFAHPSTAGDAEFPTVHMGTKRQKSVSVCLATLPPPNAPRTIDQYEHMTMRNGFPQSLSTYELCQVRLPALSTSEVFHEMPGMYVYRERPVTYPYMKPKKHFSIVEFAKKRKHTLIAVAFGVIAITAVMIIIVLQTTGDFG